MNTRIIAVTAFLVGLAVLAACGGRSTPTPTPTPAPIATPTVFGGSHATAFAPTPTPTPTPSLYTGYLTEEIPPCTVAPGSIVDPCDPDAERFSFSLGHADLWGVNSPTSVREMLGGSPPPLAFAIHFVVRGTYLPGTGRCTAGDPFRPPAYLQSEFGHASETPTEWSIKCYMDIRVNSYIVNDGLNGLLKKWLSRSQREWGMSRC